MTDNLRVAVDQCLDTHRGGGGDAFLDLVELGGEVIPILAREYRRSLDSPIRELCVRVIAHFRDPQNIPLLAEALADQSDVVWKAALDGLEACPCTESIDAITLALSSPPDGTGRSQFAEWAREAIEQIELDLEAGPGVD